MTTRGLGRVHALRPSIVTVLRVIDYQRPAWCGALRSLIIYIVLLGDYRRPGARTRMDKGNKVGLSCGFVR